ncbi:MAG: T9SS type A sorting domain-containing protein, partial [Bacteroidota bacterium]
ITAGYFLNRCSETDYTVTYENQGTTPTAPSLLRVITDPDFSPTRSFPAWDQQSGDTLFYNLAPVPVGVGGQVKVFGQLGCEATPVGQTHCTEAKVFPDSLCTPSGINWDGSSLEVNGRCEADTVIFEIRNVSDFDMTSPTQYIITEDVVLHFGGEIELRSNSAETIRIPAAGATYQLIAQQPEGHPGSSAPTIAIEGCGAASEEDASRGFIGQYPNDDGDPFIAIDCRVNNGEGPNGLLGAGAGAVNKVLTESRSLICSVIPSGIGTEHFVDAGIPLRYRLSFLNPTTDTLRRLVITDTLSGTHDLTSVTPGPASHPYRFEQTPYGVLRFLFDSIVLPPGGLGVLSFSVAQAPGKQAGTVIRNQASISYQGRGYQASNVTELRLRKEQRYGFVRDTSCQVDFANLPDLLRQRDTLVSSEFDSVSLRLTLPLPAYALTIDTSLRRGDSLLGFQLFRDTMILESLLTSAGCDSTITFQVAIDPGTSSQWHNARQDELRVYPNPVRDLLLVQAVRPVTAAELVDAVGRRHPIRLSRHNQGVFAADVRQLPPGLYYLRLKLGGQSRVVKVVKTL